MQYKDPNNAFLIELIGGFFGFLGLGYFYAGDTQNGLIRLLIWLAYVAAAWIGIALLSLVLVGLICIPIQAAIQIAVPIWSAFSLKNKLEAMEPAADPAPAAELPATASEGKDEA